VILIALLPPPFLFLSLTVCSCVAGLRRDPGQMFSQSSASTLTSAGLYNQAVTLLLPQVLVFLLLRPVAEFLLAFLRFIQMIEERVLPGFEALCVHKQMEGTEAVGADQFDTPRHVEDILSLSSPQTQEILRSGASYLLEMIILQFSRLDNTLQIITFTLTC